MKKEDLKKFHNKSIKIFLKNGYVYSGIIVDISEETIMVIDKFGGNVLIALDNISSITELGVRT
jgi:hypothetical protein